MNGMAGQDEAGEVGGNHSYTLFRVVISPSSIDYRPIQAQQVYNRCLTGIGVNFRPTSPI